MPPALSTRMAGLPRWAWLLILSSGLIMGLFIRKRNLENTAAGVDPTTEGDATGDPVPIDYGDPAVIGASAIPAGGAGGLTPVESPVLPPGYSDSFGAAIAGLVDIATNRDNAKADVQVAAINTPPPTSPTSVVTGGGPPSVVPIRTSLGIKNPPPGGGGTGGKSGGKGLPTVTDTRCKGGYRQYRWNGNWHTARPDGTGAKVKCGGKGSGGKGGGSG